MTPILDAVFCTIPQGTQASELASAADAPRAATRGWQSGDIAAHRVLALHALTASPAQARAAVRTTPSAADAPESADAVNAVLSDSVADLIEEGYDLVAGGHIAGGLHLLSSLVRLTRCAHDYRLHARTAAAACEVLDTLDARAPLGHVQLAPRQGAALCLSVQRLTVLAQMVVAFGRLYRALEVPEVRATFVLNNGEEALGAQRTYAHAMVLAAAQEAHMFCREATQAMMASWAHASVMRDITHGLFGPDPTLDPRVAAHFAALRWPYLDAFVTAVGQALLAQEPSVQHLHQAVYAWQRQSQQEIVALVADVMPEALHEVEAFGALAPKAS